MRYIFNVLFISKTYTNAQCKITSRNCNKIYSYTNKNSICEILDIRSALPDSFAFNILYLNTRRVSVICNFGNQFIVCCDTPTAVM